mmetsp:Transcript_6811/g.14792  ORF Transcript_6811/g.14792 Transcript_6811/m.14792 type:complete len:300 (+) Transcript_6811:857-1756(+)
MALDDDNLLKHQGRLVRTAEVGSARLNDSVRSLVYEEAGLRHLGSVLLLALCGPRPVLVCLHLTVEAEARFVLAAAVEVTPRLLVSGLILVRLRHSVVVRGPCRFVPESSQVALLHQRPLHMDNDGLLLLVSVDYFQLQAIRHDILLCQLLLVVVDPQLDANPVPWLEAQSAEGLVVWQGLLNLYSSSHVHHRQRILRDAQLILKVGTNCSNSEAQAKHLRLAIALRQNHEVDCRCAHRFLPHGFIRWSSSLGGGGGFRRSRRDSFSDCLANCLRLRRLPRLSGSAGLRGILSLHGFAP